jgi:hypothetical protein
MMNDEAEQFERRLRCQTMREVPREWRAEILSAAGRGSKAESRAQADRWPSTLVTRLSTLLWPHPKAWAGLAAVWICIFVLNFSTRDRVPSVAQKISAPSPEMIVELKKQQRMFAELVGTLETPDADRQKIFSPKPRSERVEILMI